MKNADTNVIRGIFDNQKSFYLSSLVLRKQSCGDACLYSLEEVKKVYENALIFLETIKKETVEYSNFKNERKLHKKIRNYNKGNIKIFIGKIKKKKIKTEVKSYGNQKFVD